MKSLFVVALALVAVCAEDGYTTVKGVEISAIVNDENTLKAVVACFTEKEDCNEQNAAFKKILPEALQQACAKCTSVQKHNVKDFLEALKNKLPSVNDEFRAKYDPDNKLFPKLEEAIAAY